MAQAQKTRYAILGALTVFPMSGYDLKKWIKDVTGPFWAESSGRIYPQLAELLRNKLVTCELKTSAGKREKKVYTITAKGKKVLEKWLVEPASNLVARDEFKLKLFYGRNLSAAQYQKHLEQHLEKMELQLKDHLHKEQHIKSDHADHPDAKYWLMAIKGAIYYDQARIEWCKELISMWKSKK